MSKLLSGWGLAFALSLAGPFSPLAASADAACPGDKKTPSLTCPGDKKTPSACPDGDKKKPSACPDGDKKKPSEL